MKKCACTALLIAISLVLTTSLSFAATVVPEAKGGVKAAGESKTGVKAGMVDINSASEAELKAIPGLGGAYAAKIIKGRPYANKTQLKSRNILPAPAYEKVKELIIAKQPKKK